MCTDGIFPIQQYTFALGFSFVDQIGTENRFRRGCAFGLILGRCQRCCVFSLILDRRQEEDKKLEFPVFRDAFGK